MITVRLLALILISVIGLSSANAVEPNEILKDPVLEQRARALSR